MSFPLTICLHKKRDGASTMTCVRADGTVTGQRSGVFFIGHDLGHYSIETTLGLHSAFYGMLARGWDIEDFGTPWPRGPLPPDALEDLTMAEGLAGMLDRERDGSASWTAEECDYWLRQAFAQAELPPPHPLTETNLEKIRAVYRRLAAQWLALLPGETLELPFPPTKIAPGVP